MSSMQTMSNGKKKFLWTSAGSLLVVMSMVIFAKPAYGQFDLGAIMAMMDAIQQVITSTITPILTSINTVTGSMQSFQQTTMYPLREITANQSMAAASVNNMTNMQLRFAAPVNSATMPATQALESRLLSGNENNVSNLGSSYSNVYGTLPSSTSLNPDVRTVVDMNDAQAQDGYKKAIQLDSIANTETTLSQQYMQQLASTSPGDATLVQAQAAAWNLQAAAYTQQGLAELLRLQAAGTANQSFNVKHINTQHQVTLRNLGVTPPSN